MTMKKKKIRDKATSVKPVHLPASAKAMRLSGMIAPTIFLVYFILIELKIIDVDIIVGPIVPLIMLFIWMTMGTIQFFHESKSKVEVAIRLVFHHLVSSSLLIIFSAIASPLILLWLILITACYVYFSTTGVMLNILTFITVIFIDALLWNDLNINILASNSLIMIGILTTSTMLLFAFHRTRKASEDKLEKSKAQEMLQKDKVMTIVNNMADALISTDEKGIINIYNAAALSLLDTNKSLAGYSIQDILPLKDMNDNDFYILDELQIVKKVSRRNDLIYYFSDDDKMRLEITYAPIRKDYQKTKKTGPNDGYILIIRDITKEKSLEEERDEFVSVVSHELRTPITIAEGTLSNIKALMEHPDSTTAMLKDSIKVAHKQIIYLASMVNDLSTLSRAERGIKDKPELVDVRELGNELHNKYLTEATNKKIKLDLDMSPGLGQITVSRLYVEELLQNLMTNALKYTKKGSIKISIKKEGDKITFAIIDTGIGISKSDQNKVFDKFFRSEDYRTRETGGTGLGLYIAKKLARQLGSTIELTSRLNFGSTFSFTINTNRFKKEKIK